MAKIKEAAVVLIINNGLILAISRRGNPETYGLIGGKVDDGETIEQAAKRECLEETGIVINECVPIFESVEPAGPDGIEFYAYFYYAPSWKGEPFSAEGLEVKWLTAEELTHTKAAFGVFNYKALEIFKQKYPNTYIKGM